MGIPQTRDEAFIMAAKEGRVLEINALLAGGASTEIKDDEVQTSAFYYVTML